VVLDSSAIVAILLQEPGHERLIESIERADLTIVGVPTLLETVMVLTARLR
jgi:ribonuclease VapC